jgi:hypothetical protein
VAQELKGLPTHLQVKGEAEQRELTAPADCPDVVSRAAVAAQEVAAAVPAGMKLQTPTLLVHMDMVPEVAAVAQEVVAVVAQMEP